MKRLFTSLGIVVLFGGGLLSSGPPARAQQPDASLSCEQISAEIQTLSAELEQLSAGIEVDPAAEQRALNRRLLAATVSGLIPVPFLGSIIGQAVSANPGEERRLRDDQQRAAAGRDAFMERVPALAERMRAMGELYGQSCVTQAGTAAAPGAAGTRTDP